MVVVVLIALNIGITGVGIDINSSRRWSVMSVAFRIIIIRRR
jgi:hypothetical protein